VSTPTLATLAQLEARTPGGIAPSDQARALAALEDASAWIRSEAGTDWIDDAGAPETVPPVIVSICCSVARRVLDNPDALTSETVAGWSGTRADSSSDTYLTSQERSMIHKVVGSGGGMVNIPLESPYLAPGSWGYYLDDENRLRLL